MPDSHQTIADYGAAWQETDAPKRLALLERCFAENGRYTDPTADVHGRAHLATHIGEVLSSAGGRVELTSKPTQHHDVAHFTWHMVASDGSIVVSGHDFARFDTDGRIVQLAGFFGHPAPLS
ncbi:nuclear transport factor 2 family protein [Ruegeria sp.]|uniref:nuclear transport factor 2 family protein n=1 Tax=Ruegeria sp. TaxID=1879320 RepID=UPI003B5BA842